MESSSNNGMIQPLIFLYMYLYAIVPEFFPTAKQGTFGQPLSAFLSQRATMIHSSPLWLPGEKKCANYNHKTTIWVPHEYYLNPKSFKILLRAFWVIAILRFFPYMARVDFKGLISK